MFGPLISLLRRIGTRRYPVWYHPHYRLPVTALESRLGLEPRRADYVAWYLQSRRLLRPGDLHTPRKIRYRDLARVHGRAYLESLTRPETLAPIFGADPWDVPVDEVLHTIRLATGGTLEAARHVLRQGGPALNLLGGFHHASRNKGAGLSPVNDIAVAIAALREDGFAGQAVILDLDAHPPDGTADCLYDDDRAWIGSMSGSDWGVLDNVDETILPAGTPDGAYLELLRELLERMPLPELAFVLAGGDVLRGDQFGTLGMTLEGARERDRMVARALHDVPSVWVPAGGYTDRAWRLLAGTALVLANHPGRSIPGDLDPMTLHFRSVSAGLKGPGFEPEPWITEADLADLGFGPTTAPRLLRHYTAEGLEYALGEYGILDHLRRLGYADLEISIDRTETGDRFQIHGHAAGSRHLLTELVASKETTEGERVLYVNWLTLRHPLGTFSDKRPRLPGQEVPGQGLAREAGELLERMAIRLNLAGIAFRPAWFHTAYAARYHFQFADAERQGRFEALLRDLGHLPLLQLTRAISDERVAMDGAPYTWEADDMVHWIEDHPSPDWDDRAVAERERVHFELIDPEQAAPTGYAEARQSPGATT